MFWFYRLTVVVPKTLTVDFSDFIGVHFRTLCGFLIPDWDDISGVSWWSLSGPMARIELKRKRFLRNLPFWRCYWFWEMVGPSSNSVVWGNFFGNLPLWRCYWFWVGNGRALFKLCGLKHFFWQPYWFWVGNGGALFKLCSLRQFFVFSFDHGLGQQKVLIL